MRKIFILIDKAEKLRKRQDGSYNVFHCNNWETARQSLMNEAKTLTEKLGYEWKEVILSYYKIRG